MKFFDRLLLILLALAGLAGGVLAILIALGWRKPVDLLEVGLLQTNVRVLLGTGGAILALLALHFLFDRHRERHLSSALIRRGDLGETWITVEVLEALVTKAVRQVGGVREVRPRIKVVEGGIAVLLRITTYSDTALPGLAEEIQKAVKVQVATTAGIEVVEVRILVETLAQEARARVE